MYLSSEQFIQNVMYVLMYVFILSYSFKTLCMYWCMCSYWAVHSSRIQYSVSCLVKVLYEVLRQQLCPSSSLSTRQSSRLWTPPELWPLRFNYTDCGLSLNNTQLISSHVLDGLNLALDYTVSLFAWVPLYAFAWMHFYRCVCVSLCVSPCVCL
jgi:hypothetical protein